MEKGASSMTTKNEGPKEVVIGLAKRSFHSYHMI